MKKVKLFEQFVNGSSITEKIKYKKGKTYQSEGPWTVVVDTNSSGLSINVNNSAGWRLDPQDEKEETFQLLDNGRQRATMTFKEGNIDAFAQKMWDRNSETTHGEKEGLTAKDYADIIRVWIDMKMANESVVNEATDLNDPILMKMRASKKRAEDLKKADAMRKEEEKKRKKDMKRWNQRKYDKWLEDVASNGGWENAFDMAQNAESEPGLIDWVKKEFRGEDPMQRIQWDIEAFAESVVNESKDEVTPKQLANLQKDIAKINKNIKVYISTHPITKGKLQIELGADHDNDDEIDQINSLLDKHTGDWRTGTMFNESNLNEANRGKVHKAAKSGSYPAVIVVVQKGKVIHQEPVSSPQVAPATFNVMQGKYPDALIHLEDKTGKRLFSESFVVEKREDVGKYNTVKKAIKAIKKEYGPTPTEQSVASFINDNYYDVTEVERGDDDPQANDKIADLIASYKFDIDDWEIAWADAQNESVVNEGAFVIYIDGPKGKELLGTFHNKRAAEKYKKEEEDEVLNTKGVDSIGMMSKDMWDKKEAPYIKESVVNEARNYKEKPDGDHMVKATVCYLKPMTRQRECKAIYFKSRHDALGFKDKVRGFPKGAAVEAINDVK